MSSRTLTRLFVLVSLIGWSTATAAAQEPGPPPPYPELHRWIDLQSGTIDFRYRYIQTSLDELSARQLQHRQGLRVGFKFDRGGRYTVQTFSGTGAAFPSSWNNTGLGTGEANWPFAMRQFYVAAKPVAGLSARVGGFSQYKGAATEITAFDNDNYLVGYRIAVERPEDLFVDEISVSLGYVGDFTEANVFRRLDRLGDHNYTQVLVGKQVASRVLLTVDWEEFGDVSTFHQAVRVSTEDWNVVHGLRFEQYERVNGDAAYGFAVAADRALTRHLELTGGYAQIDREHPPLNGDRYFRGKRVFLEATYTFVPEFDVSVYYGHAFDNDFFVANDQRFDVVASYDVVTALKRSGAW